MRPLKFLCWILGHHWALSRLIYAHRQDGTEYARWCLNCRWCGLLQKPHAECVPEEAQCPTP
jgi:hypothetical protein